MLITARTLFHPDNGAHSMLLSIVDATDQHRRDAAKDMLFRELRHRMKNLLGVLHSVALHTTTEARTAEEYRDDFLARFDVVVAAQELAFAEQEEAGLKQLFERIFAPYLGDPDVIEFLPSTPVQLDPRTIMSLSMVNRPGFARGYLV